MNSTKNLDRTLVEITSATPHSIADVVDRLEAVQQNAESQAPRFKEDGIASFNYLYTIITKDVQEKLQQGGYFKDSDFLTTLDVEFAKRYLSAVGCYAAKLLTPRSWSVLFDHRGNDSIRTIQYAIAGVNAHVDYDLAFALVSTCQILGRTLGEDSQHYDYQRINEIFSIHMRELRKHFENKFETEIDDWMVADLADDAGDLTVVVSRDMAWRRAVQLWEIRDDQEATAKERAHIDWRVSMISRGILSLPLI